MLYIFGAIFIIVFGGAALKGAFAYGAEIDD